MKAIVIGAGIIGTACARELALAGVRVTLVDRAGAAGATTAHGEGNVLVSDKGPGAELRLAQFSRRLWPEVTGDGTEWQAKGGIVVATTEEGARELTAFAAAQRTAGVRAEPLGPAELASAEPHLTRDVTAAVHYPDDAQVQPAGAANVLLDAARREGATLLTGCEVLGTVARGGRLTAVRTTAGTLEADLFVNAAGPWAGVLSRRLGAPVDVRPRRGEILVTTPLPPTVFHKVYDADYVGAVGGDTDELQASAVVESTRAGTVLLGSSRRAAGFDDRLRPEVLSVIAERALRLFPCLSGVPAMRAYGGFRPYVTDHLPIIGADPRVDGLWHATGHEGAGIGLAPGTARLLTDLVTGRTPEVDAAPFRVDRPAVLPQGAAG
ncbi:FAD-dependent oxidoreductase [Actinoallomurus oryzae]|uniref:FAD-dependent oxidoreductase n=1 Tax=Actinoallomurus oryzae TaxID=502180 RepID=A0ABP8R7K6_9ACTN